MPVSSRVSSKIQQLVNTLKKPKRRPLREYFIDDFEELLEGTNTMIVIFGTLQVGVTETFIWVVAISSAKPSKLPSVYFVLLKVETEH